MVFDAWDEKIILNLDGNARISLVKLQQEVNLKKETIRYRIKKLEDEGIIEKYNLNLDPSRFLATAYRFYLKLHHQTEKIEHRIKKFLKEYEGISLIQSCEGYYDIVFNFLCYESDDLERFIVELKKSFSEYIFEKSFNQIIASHYFNKNYLIGEKGDLRTITYKKKPLYQADKIDILILKKLSRDAKISAVALSKICNITVKAVIDRIKKMEKNAVIMFYNISLNYAELKKMVITLDVSLRNSEHINILIEFFRKYHSCIAVHKMIGQYDVSLELIFDDASNMRKTIQRFKNLFAEETLYYDLSTVLDYQDLGLGLPAGIIPH